MSLFTDNTKVIDVLNRMKLGESCHIQHPFPSGYQKPDTIIESDENETVSESTNNEKEDNPIILGDMLISATINGDYNKCNELLEREDVATFIDNKDGQGFSSLDYSVINGFPRITNALINAGCKNELRPMEELISIPKRDDGVFFTKEVEEKYEPSIKESTNSKSISFADAFKRNFKKSGFSNDRKDTVKVPVREEITPEIIEASLPKSYNERHVLFLSEFAGKEVTRLLIQPAHIRDEVLEHRRNMLPYGVNKPNLLKMVSSVIKEQDDTVTIRKLKKITDEIYDTLVFYRDMYMRMIDNNKVVIKESPIHGKGVFANCKIKRGSIVTFYIPYMLEYVNNKDGRESYVIVPVLSNRKFTENNQGEIEELRKGTIKFSENMLMIGDDEYYSDTRFVGHMVNDGCIFPEHGKISFFEYEDQVIRNTNVEVVPFNLDRKFICLISNRDIEPGEEILVAYGCNYWDDKVYMSDNDI